MKEEKVKTQEYDILVLGDGIEYSSDCSKTNCNNNVVVIGGTGSGKTFSIVLKRLIQTMNSNLIVATVKDRLYDITANALTRRGYKVEKLDFVHPKKSTVYYNPFEMFHSWEGVTQFCSDVVYSNKHRENSSDPYWNECAVSLLAAIVGYNKCTKANADMGDVIKMFNSLKIISSQSDGGIKTTLDEQFCELKKQAGSEHYITRMWNTIANLPMNTLNCVISSLSTTLDKTFSSEVLENFTPDNNKGKFDIDDFVENKTILFINSSPYNLNTKYLLNILYASMFQNLFEIAEKNNGSLRHDVQVIFDDFAAGGAGGINGFEEYISTFRQAGLSVMLLLQSQSQLEQIYGRAGAVSILDNCDTTVFMGSNSYSSAKNMAERISRPVEEVLYMENGKEIVFRRGEKPKYYVDRYPILKDPVYIEWARQGR